MTLTTTSAICLAGVLLTAHLHFTGVVPYISLDLKDMYLDINHFNQNFNPYNSPMSWHYYIKNLQHWSQIWVDTEPTELSLIGIFNFFLNAVDLFES